MGQASLKSGESDGLGSARARGEPGARVRVCQAWGVLCTVTRVPDEFGERLAQWHESWPVLMDRAAYEFGEHQ
eukprot:1241937-Rhodomonas_salina.1